uniref:Uncharacterized protein HGP-02 n=1 Tax=uncultured Candidatus Nitrosocaldus sp. TaxID=766501 RepID=Q1ERC4_9ARCH|nr:hypothetical protein [uncultured Candidatus Nitrosocaldus sp.]
MLVHASMIGYHFLILTCHSPVSTFITAYSKPLLSHTVGIESIADSSLSVTTSRTSPLLIALKALTASNDGYGHDMPLVSILFAILASIRDLPSLVLLKSTCMVKPHLG